MTTYDGDLIKCTDCDRTVAGHRWGKIKASDWFFGKDGSAYCPDHVPSWVSVWRAGKKE